MCGASLPCSVRDYLLPRCSSHASLLPPPRPGAVAVLDNLSLAVGACAAALCAGMRPSSSKTQPATHAAPAAAPAVGCRTGIPAVSAAPDGLTRTTALAPDSSDTLPAMPLAVTALLGSVSACVAMPLCRRLGSMLDPVSCPDNCWQAVVVPALVVGPIVGCLAFVVVGFALRWCSVTQWGSFIGSAAIAAAGAVISGAARAGDASRPRSMQSAPLTQSVRCPSLRVYPAACSLSALSARPGESCTLATNLYELAMQVSGGTAFDAMQPRRSDSSHRCRCRQSQSSHCCRSRQLCWQQQRWQQCQQPGPRSGGGARPHHLMVHLADGGRSPHHSRCRVPFARAYSSCVIARLFVSGTTEPNEQQTAPSSCSGAKLVVAGGVRSVSWALGGCSS